MQLLSGWTCRAPGPLYSTCRCAAATAGPLVVLPLCLVCSEQLRPWCCDTAGAGKFLPLLLHRLTHAGLLLALHAVTQHSGTPRGRPALAGAAALRRALVGSGQQPGGATPRGRLLQQRSGRSAKLCTGSSNRLRCDKAGSRSGGRGRRHSNSNSS